MRYTNQAMRPCRSNPCYKDTVLKIERIARICYRSFDKSDGTIEGAEKLIRFLIENNHTAMIEPVSLTFYIKTNRNIANEIVRHRIASYAQESTRYVNYGGKEMEFIPCEELTDYAHVEEFYTKAEKIYKNLVNEGIPPQVARDVLPGAIATNISATFNLRSLRNFLKLRTAKTAHPQMRELAGMILEYVKREYPVFFEDIYIDICTKEA